MIRSEFTTADGQIALSDATALRAGACGHDIGLDSPHVVLRRIEGIRGCVEVQVDFAPRMEYGLTEPNLDPFDGGVVARGGPTRLTPHCQLPLCCQQGRANAWFVVEPGGAVEMSLTYEPSFATPPSRHPRPTPSIDWFVDAAGRVGDEQFQIMYGVEGERDFTERTLDHLRGYRDNLPVRVGNGTWTQIQLDVLVEVIDAVHVLRDELGDLDERLQDLVVVLADRAAAQWSEPDAAMWKTRDAQRHYVSSKLMCWLALDRAIALADRLGGCAATGRWTANRDEIRHAVLDRAWSDTAGADAGAFDSDELDASVLMMAIVGFLPAGEPRMRATIEAVELHLAGDGLVRRWATDDSEFLICTFWLAECVAMCGETTRARAWFDRAAGCANDLGLMSEETGTGGAPMLGGFPQAFSHVGLINAARRIDG